MTLILRRLIFLNIVRLGSAVLASLATVIMISSPQRFLSLTGPNSISTDKISVVIFLLTLIISTLIIITVLTQSPKNAKSLNLMIWLIIVVLILVFRANSTISFYFFFEASLIPISIIILGWGYQPERFRAAIALIIYTVVASLPLLLIILKIAQNSTFDLLVIGLLLPRKSINRELMSISCTIMILGFLVKFPIYSVHLWLPKAHVEAPVVGSMVLAAILLKLGGFGVWRISQAVSSSYISNFILSFSLLGGAAISILCLRQSDIKVLIAYSSVRHMRLVISCLIRLTRLGFMAGLIIIIAHGISSSGIFAGANFIYEHTHTRNLIISGGLISTFPTLSILWFIMCLGNMGAPPTVNLLAEIWRIIRIANISFWLIPIFIVSSFMAVAYSLIIYASPNQGQINENTALPKKYSHLSVIVLLSHGTLLVETIIFF